jgi:hypothetical protein
MRFGVPGGPGVRPQVFSVQKTCSPSPGQGVTFEFMPQRPSKKSKARPTAKPGIGQTVAGDDQKSQQRHEEKTARAIIGRFQGRTSIERNK